MIAWYFDRKASDELSDVYLTEGYQERSIIMSKHTSIMTHTGLNASKGTSPTTNSGKLVGSLKK